MSVNAYLFCIPASVCCAAKTFDPGISRVENDKSQPLLSSVATTQYNPGSSAYVVQGKVRYENVEGGAYLEMWNTMPDGRCYFTRTLDDVGPMRKITGSSDWRNFQLPFNLDTLKPESVKLDINVVMPGKGTIELSRMTVSDLSPSVAGELFGRQTGNMIVGILGTLGGIYGGTVGCLCGFFAPKGKGKRWVKGLFLLGILFGIASLILGVCAVILEQPFRVWYPFVLVGGIMCIVLSITFSQINKVYAQAELRRIRALDM